MKKIIAGMLATIAVFGAVPNGNFIVPEKSAFTASALDLDVIGKGSEGNFSCEYLSDGSIIIDGYFGTETEITIPDEINGHAVKYLNIIVYSDKEIFWAGVTKINISTNLNLISERDYITSNNAIKYFSDMGITANITDNANQDAPPEIPNEPINETNFPDGIFRQYIADNFDTDEDGVLSKEEIDNTTTIIVGEKGISDLTGIEHFTALTKLVCWCNQLASLDVSNNTALTFLSCGRNQLTSLDVSNNTALTYLCCDMNLLTSLDVSNNTALTELICDNNQLTSLDVSNNTSLTELVCYFNQLTSLNVSNNIELTNLNCSENQLTSLDISKNTKLTELYCNYNTYKIPHTDSKFDLSTLPTGFDISKASEWTNGTVEGNILTVEDVTKNVTYTYNCGNEKTATFKLIPTDKPPLPLGDINGSGAVDSSDASNVLEVYALVSTGKDSELTEEQKKAADVNKDGSIDSSDASIILAYYAYTQTGGTGTLEEYLNS